MDDEILRLMHYRSCLRRFLRQSKVLCGNAGITQAQYELMLAVDAGTKRRSGPPTIGFAAKALSVRPSTVVELVDRSERNGLVVRKRDVNDARTVRLTITKEGHRLLVDLVGLHTHEWMRLMSDLQSTGDGD
jgi:DNA-binding MarR family transcriptional regulator